MYVPTRFGIRCYDNVVWSCFEVLDVVPVFSEVFGHVDSMKVKQCRSRWLLHLNMHKSIKPNFSSHLLQYFNVRVFLKV